MFHDHEQAWTASLVGLKRWIIWDKDTLTKDPPPFQLGFDTENKQFFETIYTTSAHERWLGRNGWECVQEPGELLYIPGRMQHLVLNIGETVAVTGSQPTARDDPAVGVFSLITLSPSPLQASTVRTAIYPPYRSARP